MEYNPETQCMLLLSRHISLLYHPLRRFSTVSSIKMQAQIIHEYGGPEKFTAHQAAMPVPKPSEVLVAIEYAGVNFIDTYMRTCLADAYKRPLPAILGREGAGTVLEVGSEASQYGITVGDRVCFGTGFTGAYATHGCVPAAHLIKIPSKSVSSEVAAALMLQGMTAHYLVQSVPTSTGVGLQKGAWCLVHAGAGGVGRLVIQMAKMRGATVIATVSTEEKAAEARSCGADHIILYTSEDVAQRVRAITSGRGVDIVYDGVGKSTFMGSLDSLAPRGMLALYGNASGTPPPVEPLELMKRGSLMVTRTNLAHFTEKHDELVWRASECLDWVAQGKLNVKIDKCFGLSQVADAHRALEGRGTMGKIILDTSK